tara:strand:+ start:63 stop:266 length:204 start_codon:yes stop_codon:yes gene_type:complete
MSDEDESIYFTPQWNGFKVVPLDLRLPYDQIPCCQWDAKKNHPILSKQKEKEKELKVIEEKQKSIEL